jgi:hypothetical protein
MAPAIPSSSMVNDARVTEGEPSITASIVRMSAMGTAGSISETMRRIAGTRLSGAAVAVFTTTVIERGGVHSCAPSIGSIGKKTAWSGGRSNPSER